MISVFILGFLFSFLGYTPPSVLNMTALKIRLQRNKKDFHYFISGVLLIVALQAYISVYFTKYITDNQKLVILLEKGGIVVLLMLSYYFYHQNKKEKKRIEIDNKNKNTFFTGIFLSILNMFAIPFFSGIVAFLMSFKLMNFDTISILFFVIGIVIGTFYILYLYGKYASKIQQKTGNMTQNINLVLCCITGGFALFTFLKFVI